MQLTQLRLSVQKLLTYLTNLWVVLAETHRGERVQSLNYAFTLGDGPSTGSIVPLAGLWIKEGFNPQSYRSIIWIQSSVNTLHTAIPPQRREGWSNHLATVLNYDPGAPDLGKSPNPFSCLPDLSEMAISYLTGLLGDIKTLDLQTQVPLSSLIYGTTASHTDLCTAI